MVLKCLKKLPGASVQGIPSSTKTIIQNIPRYKWAPDQEVDELLKKLPQQIKDALLPFQLEGVMFGLRRRGRCLIADEMGLGKTLQVGIDEFLHSAILAVLYMSTLVYSCGVCVEYYCFNFFIYKQQNSMIWQVSMEYINMKNLQHY